MASRILVLPMPLSPMKQLRLEEKLNDDSTIFLKFNIEMLLSVIHAKLMHAVGN